MKYIKNTMDFSVPDDTAVTLGKFDGIHKGHRHLLRFLEEKKSAGLTSVIFTFDAPPAWRVGGGQTEKVLTTNQEKARLFEQCGVDVLLECPFTKEVRSMEPEAFIQMLAERLHVKSFVVGTDFRFGHGRKGDYRLLQSCSGAYGYDVKVVGKALADGREISSTYIREVLMAGRVGQAGRLLGYPYFVQGEVVHGNEIGRTLNAPTANLLPPREKLLPPFGVYVTRAEVDGRAYGGITNVGRKPTIAGDSPVGVETHLFDFSAWIYGKEMKVEFLKAVRPERKFASLEELKSQMAEDMAYGRRCLAGLR